MSCAECVRLQAEIEQMERESEIDAAAIRELENANDILTKEVAKLTTALRETKLSEIAAYMGGGRKQHRVS